ncbi:MAG: hypothetical protein IPK06_04515 [Ignavibacteriae bacterium]|nr:hypothetical protein [Ignavibacteriota bacterium]
MHKYRFSTIQVTNNGWLRFGARTNAGLAWGKFVFKPNSWDGISIGNSANVDFMSKIYNVNSSVNHSVVVSSLAMSISKIVILAVTVEHQIEPQ